MCRVIDFFHTLNCAANENAFINICEIERDNIRSKHSTFQSMKTKFSQYRNYLRKNYYEYNPVLNTAITNIELLKKQGNNTDKSLLLTATTFSLSLSDLKREYSRYLIVLKYLKIEDFENRKINEDYNATVKSRRSNLRYIIDVEGYIDRAVRLLNTDSFIDNVLGLAALTGRRVAEIGCTAEFSYVDDFTVKFKGQLKTKDLDNLTSIEIPVLTDSKLIITALERVRKNFPQYIKEPLKFHNNCSSALSKKAYQFESFVEDKVTAKDLRAIYAAIAFDKYCHDDRMDDTVYYSNVLGHDERDTHTCLSYTKYKIKK